MKTFPNVDWNLPVDANGRITWEMVHVAVLMDIRRELRQLNGLLSCPNFTSIPSTLRQIQRNTKKRKRQKRSA